jgi:OFA family oxalate/formate antiporter-like MFS transporter
VAAIVVQVCLGGIYAWSTFIPALQASHGYSATETQLVFGTAFLVFTGSLLVTGPLLDRVGPRPLMLASGLLLAGGYLLGAASGGVWWRLWLGIGVVGGLGIGCGYLAPIAAAIRHYPGHEGLVSGLAVAGYGGGAVLLAGIGEALLEAGWAPERIFRLVGLTYGPVVLLAGLLLWVPGGRAPPPPFSRRALLGDLHFWKLLAAMLLGTMPGLVVSGNLKPMGLWSGHDARTAALAISSFAVGSASGRVLWGLVRDRLGSRRATRLALATITLSIAVLAGVASWRVGFLGAVLLVGFGYGSSFSLYPAQVAELYGPRLVGTVYSVVMLGHGLAGELGPGLAGLGHDLTGSYAPALLLAGLAGLAGWLAFGWLDARAPPGITRGSRATDAAG